MPPRSATGRGAGPRGGGPTRGGGAGRGGVPVGTMTGSHLNTVGVRRPGFGTGGRVVNTIINAFATTIPDVMIYHYDAISPDTLPARVNMLLIDTLTKHVAPTVFNRPIVYDGRKNIYSMYRIAMGPNDSGSFDVSFAREGPSGPNARPPKIYKVKVTKVAEINTEVLHRFIDGKQSEDSTVSTSLMALNTVIRMDPNQKYPFNVRSFFTPEGKRLIGGGLELWRGYFQSLRPSQGRMYINLDIATGVMYKAGRLLDVCLEYVNQRDPKLLSPTARFPDRERLRLQRFISGMRVTTKHGGRTRTLTIKKLSAQGANQLMFTTREGQSQSVANYFRTVLNKSLQFPDVICIEVGSGALIPLELCEVPAGQIMRKQIPPEKTNDMLEFSKLVPAERLASIRKGLSVLQYGQSDYVREFGMAVQPTPLTVKSRILMPPTLKYGTRSREATIRPANGQWNMRDKMLFKTSVINTWVIVIYEQDRRFPLQLAQEMATSFVEGAASVGVRVADNRPQIFYENGQGVIGDQLKKAGKACFDAKKKGPELIVVVLPEGGNQIYTAVKHFGDITMGVATQCLKSGKCGRAKIQYWANVMLKVNVKLGGINNVLDKFQVLNDPHNLAVVMGADVIHPAPGADGKPSFTSLVSSLDGNVAKYVTESRAQEGRVEMIADLESMCRNVLGKHLAYKKATEPGALPCTRLIFYRDGVSEGQFQQVLDKELPQIQAALQFHKLKMKITLIIVGKRHHIRFFPAQPGDGDKSGNCQAGTTIDEGLGHPTEFDYYQLTHGGLLGTSRPAHYSVIYDENNFNADTMQNLSFALCHVYARATRSVSIPAPVYYADIVCSRAKNHYNPGANFDLSETATQVSGTGSDALRTFQTEYKQLHPNMANVMYFM